jgi:hypothetical protein
MDSSSDSSTNIVLGRVIQFIVGGVFGFAELAEERLT